MCYESSLPIVNIDLLQVLLTLAFDIDWIRERALELVNGNESDNDYWKIAE